MNPLELIHEWMKHKLPDETLLYGIHVFWWARAGKVIQLASGSVILLNIIGIPKIRAGGERIRHLMSWQTVFTTPRILKRLISILEIDLELFGLNEEPEYTYEPVGPSDRRPVMVKTANPKYSRLENEKIRRRREALSLEKKHLKETTPFSVLIYIPGILGVGYSAYLTHTLLHGNANWLFWILALAPIFFGVNFLCAFLTVALLRFPVFVAEAFILEPVGRLLSNERLETIAMTTSFLLLVISSLIDIVLS